MKNSIFSFILLFLAVLFAGNTYASDINAPEDPGIQIEQTMNTNASDAIAVDISAELQAAPEQSIIADNHPLIQPLNIVTAAGDNDHQAIVQRLDRYRSLYKPPKYPLAKGKGPLQRFNL